MKNFVKLILGFLSLFLNYLLVIFDEDYFEHLISEIQEIRASERRFYQKITDIYGTAAIAQAFAESEFEQYRVLQDQLYQSDFDRLMEAKANKLSRLIPKTSDFFYTSVSHFRPCYLKLTVVHGYVLFPRRVQTSPAVPSGTARYPGKA